MYGKLATRHNWVRPVAEEHRLAQRADTVVEYPPNATTNSIASLCCILETGNNWDNAADYRDIPTALIAWIVSRLRRKLAPQSCNASPQRAHEWDAACAQALKHYLCPGVLRSTWERRIQRVIAEDWNSAPNFDGTNGTVAKLCEEAAGVLDAVCANSVYKMRRRLLSTAADFNLLHQRDEFGWSLLHHAAYGNCVDVIRYLVAEGLSPNATSRDGSTVLHIAAARLHMDAISFLVQAGASSSIAATDSRGKTPLEVFLNTVSLSCWHVRLSPTQISDTAVLLMRDRTVDIWRPRPIAPEAASVGDDSPRDPNSQGRCGVSLFIRFMWLADASVAQTMISLGAESFKQLTRFQSHLEPSLDKDMSSSSLWPVSERIKSSFDRHKECSRSSEEDLLLSFGRSVASDEYAALRSSIREQVRVAVALSLKRKRVRILQQLVQTFDPLLDLFNEENDTVDMSVNSSASDAAHGYTFFFRCLELAVVTKCLRTVVVMMDLGKERGFFSIANFADKDNNLCSLFSPSCFLNLVVSQGDHLLLKLVLERLGGDMDSWVTLPSAATFSPHTMLGGDNTNISKGSSSSGIRGEMALTSCTLLLQRTLNVGLMDSSIFLLRLSLFSPVSLSCLLNEHISLDIMLSRLEGPFGSSKGHLKFGCSPIVCAALSGATESLKVLKASMSEHAFVAASQSEDVYGLTALNSLVHVLRIQHDHVGHSSLWCDLASVVREEFSSAVDGPDFLNESCTAFSPPRGDHSLQHRSFNDESDVNRTPARNLSVGSPNISRFIMRSGSGLLQSSNREDEASPRSRNKAPRQSEGIDDTYLTPQKRRNQASPRSFSARKSPGKHSLSASGRKMQQQRMKIAEYRRQKKLHGDLHPDFGGGMFSMSGLRYSRREVQAVVDILTPTFSANGPAVGKYIDDDARFPPNVLALRERLLFLCDKLQQSTIPAANGSDFINLKIMRPGVRYKHVRSGNVRQAVPERIVVLFAAASDNSTSLPQGYLVEDILSNLQEFFPSVRIFLQERRRRRERWYRMLRLGHSTTLRDMGVARNGRSSADWAEVTCDTKNDTAGYQSEYTDESQAASEELFRAMLATYSDASFRPTHEVPSQSESFESSVALTLGSPAFLRKMRILTSFMVASFAPSSSIESSTHPQEPKIKPDRSWAILGQCVWLLLDGGCNSGSVCSAEQSWNNIRKKFSQSSGVVAVKAMEAMSEEYVTFDQFLAVLRLIDPMNIDKYRDSTISPPSSINAIRAFSARVIASVSKHGLWVRDRFGLCLSTLTKWMELVLSDADAVISSEQLFPVFNRDNSPMCFQDESVAIPGKLSCSDIISHVEEAMYLDSLLSRANVSHFDSAVNGSENASAAHHRSAIACLLNASYSPLPMTLPAVICAIGYVIRELVNMALVSPTHPVALKVGVSTEVGIGACNHLGCMKSASKLQLVRRIDAQRLTMGLDNHLSAQIIPIAPGVERGGEFETEAGDDYPSVLFEETAHVLIEKYISNVRNLGNNKNSCLPSSHKCTSVQQTRCFTLSAPMQRGVLGDQITPSRKRSMGSILDQDLHAVVCTMSPLFALAGRKLWSAIEFVLDNQEHELNSCIQGDGQLYVREIQDEAYLCPFRGDHSKESTEFNARVNVNSAVLAMCSGLDLGYDDFDTRERFNAYVGGYPGSKKGSRGVAPNDSEPLPRCAIKAANYELVGFMDMCLVNGASVQLMLRHLKARLPAGASLCYMDLADIMLRAIQRQRYEVCSHLLAFVVSHEANIALPVSHQFSVVQSTHGASMEKRDWAVQTAYVMFCAHLDAERSSHFHSIMLGEDCGTRESGIRSVWHMPLINGGTGPDGSARTGRVAARRSQSNAARASDIVTHCTGKLSGLCQDKRTGGVIMRDGSVLPLQTLFRCMPLLQWTMPPAYLSSGIQSAKGHTVFHTLLSLGERYFPVLEKLIEYIYRTVCNTQGNEEVTLRIRRSLKESMYAPDIHGETPVHRALMSSQSSVVSLEHLLDHAALKGTAPSSDDNRATIDTPTNVKIPAPVDRNLLFEASAATRLRAVQWLQDSIENPVMSRKDIAVAPLVGGNVMSHRQCCLLYTLIRLLNRVENQWRQICRADFRPLLKCLYSSLGSQSTSFRPSTAAGVATCPYNSVHRAKNVLLALKMPFSSLQEGSHRKVGGDEDFSLSGLDLSDLTPRKLMRAVSASTAADIRASLCEWTRARSDKISSATGIRKTLESAAKVLIKRHLEESLVVSQFIDISLSTIGELGSLEGFRRRSSRSVGSNREAWGTENCTPSGSYSRNKEVAIVDEASARKSWDTSHLLPDQLLSEMKQLHSSSNGRIGRTSAVESSLMHVANVVGAWAHNRQEIIDVLRLAYDVLDFARTVSVCRMLCSVTNIPLHFSAGTRPILTEPQLDDHMILAPAHKPQQPFIVRKDMRKKGRMLRFREDEGERIDDGQQVSDWSSSEGSVDDELLETRSVETDEKEYFVNAIEAIMKLFFSAQQYSKYVASSLEKSHSIPVLGVRSLLYPTWGSTLPMHARDLMNNTCKEYKDIVQNLFDLYVPWSGCADKKNSWWSSAFGVSEYVSVFVLLSLSTAAATKRIFRMRQRFLHCLALVCSALERHRLCEYLYRQLRKYSENTLPKPGELPQVAAELCDSRAKRSSHFSIIESQGDAAFEIVEFIHSLTIQDVILLAQQPLLVGSPSPPLVTESTPPRGKQARRQNKSYSIFGQFLKSLRSVFRCCELLNDEDNNTKESKIFTSNNNFILKGLIRADDESIPRQVVVSIPTDDAAELACEMSFLKELIGYQVHENSKISALRGNLILDRDKYARHLHIFSNNCFECEGTENLLVRRIQANKTEIKYFRERVRPSLPGDDMSSLPVQETELAISKQQLAVQRTFKVSTPPKLRPRAPVLAESDIVKGSVSAVLPATTTRGNRPHVSSAMRAAAKAVVERAEQRIHIAYHAVTLLHNFFRCLYSTVTYCPYYEADPQMWRQNTTRRRTKNSLAIAAIRLWTNEEHITKQRAEIAALEAAVCTLCREIIVRDPRSLTKFNADLPQNFQSQSYLNRSTCDRKSEIESDATSVCENDDSLQKSYDIPASPPDRENGMSALYIAALSGSAKLLSVLLSDVDSSTQSLLSGAECHRFIIWHALMEAPSLSLDERKNMGNSMRREQYELAIEMLILKGFSCENPNAAVQPCLYLAALKQFPRVVSLLVGKAGAQPNGKVGVGSRVYLSSLHLIILAPTLPATLLQEVMLSHESNPGLLAYGEVSCLDSQRDVEIHTTAIHSYVASCCVCSRSKECICPYRKHNSTRAQIGHRNRIYREISSSYLNLLSPSQRKPSCPLNRFLREVCIDLSSHLEVSNIEGKERAEVHSSRVIDKRQPVKLFWSGVHFAVASRDIYKFCAVTGLKARSEDEDPDNDDLEASTALNWLSAAAKSAIEPGHVDGSSADFAQLMHLACYYDLPKAVNLLASRALAVNRHMIFAHGPGFDFSVAELKFLAPSCYFSLFFEPYNEVCSPLQVAIRAGSATCAKACLDAVANLIKTIDASADKVICPITFESIAHCVHNGLGGDTMCSLLLRYLATTAPKEDLWDSLSRTNHSFYGSASSGESILSIAVRRGYNQFVQESCLIYHSAIVQTSRTPVIYSIRDSGGLTLLQTSIACGHRVVTQTLSPLFVHEANAIAIITLQLRKMLLRRHLRKRERELLLKYVSVT